MRCDIAAIEIYAEAPELRRRFPELRSARSRGTVISTVCFGPPFLGRLKADEIDDATRSIKDAVSLAAEIDASGIVMPLAFPPFSIPTGELPRFILDALAEVGQHAKGEGVGIFVEPLNRYEDGRINTLDQAAMLCDEVGHESLGVCGDLFHMNIEEADISQALRTASARLQHLHIADSNRRQPGAGHFDFTRAFDVLQGQGFDGWLTLECSIDTPVEHELCNAVQLLRAAWRSDEQRLESSPG
jgi:sugar phosphate isomerase/epimerase